MRISDWSSDVCSSDLLDVMEALVAAVARKASNTKLEPVEWAYGDVLIVTDEAIKTLRALPPATSAGEVWQDIVTAPKDGTPVLLWLGNDYMCGEWLTVGDYSAWFVAKVDDWPMMPGVLPTHWRPLTASPTQHPHTPTPAPTICNAHVRTPNTKTHLLYPLPVMKKQQTN